MSQYTQYTYELNNYISFVYTEYICSLISLMIYTYEIFGGKFVLLDNIPENIKYLRMFIFQIFMYCMYHLIRHKYK